MLLNVQSCAGIHMLRRKFRGGRGKNVPRDHENVQRDHENLAAVMKMLRRITRSHQVEQVGT